LARLWIWSEASFCHCHPSPSLAAAYIRSEAIITQALEKALECHCYSVDGVKQLVMGLKESLEKASPCNTPKMAEASIAMPAVSVDPVVWPEVGQFDRLLQLSNAEGEGSQS
jgi:hypothetical protein